MSIIELTNAFVDYPVFNASSVSFRNKVVEVATGGRLNKDEHKYVIVRALENINLSISAGERVGLLGHNGSGKSTLLRLLSGVYFPTKGSAEISGSVSSLVDISLGIDPEATGVENIYIRAALLGMKRREVDEILPEIIEFSGIGDYAQMPLRTYSTGMGLRLAFAVSTMIDSDVLLMDEWLSVGDEGFRVKAENRIIELLNKTKVLVIASHSEDLIRRVCNRVIWLEHGEIKMDGAPDEVLNAYYSWQKSHG